MKNKLIRLVLIFLAVVVLLAIGWVWIALHWSYSDGERAGYVQKLSRKGWLCKTWEGEIAMVTMPGAIPEKFEFSVRDDDVAQKINLLAGKRVVLDYRQYKFIPSTCFGETEYFIDGVREVVDTPAQTPVQPLAPVVSPGQLTPVR
ncbi:MAG: hypothetical protein U1E04_09395 [Hylemonella sp.]|nr:hypothetical protein [Hylemonella sp.]